MVDKGILQDLAPRFTIGVMARKTGCNIGTIRYYEKAGVIPHPARSEGGHRLYGTGHLKRLAFVESPRAGLHSFGSESVAAAGRRAGLPLC